jgi:hypothetical protein
MRKKYPPDKSLGEMKVNAYTMTLEGSRALQVIEVKSRILDRSKLNVLSLLKMNYGYLIQNF